MKARTINRHMAFELLEPSGLNAMNELFERLAYFNGAKQPYQHRYKFKLKGEGMDAEDFHRANSQAMQNSSLAPKPGSTHVSG